MYKSISQDEMFKIANESILINPFQKDLNNPTLCSVYFCPSGRLYSPTRMRNSR